jgi:hypothetical protein
MLWPLTARFSSLFIGGLLADLVVDGIDSAVLTKCRLHCPCGVNQVAGGMFRR